MENKPKILVIVEGKKTDFRLMQRLFNIYNISDNHEIVSYNTNIYNLYKEMFENSDPSSYDLLQLLKEKETDNEKKKRLDDNYSDIILIFDFDPQDTLFTSDKILKMLDYFKESSDMGKLYINYPMVESFYHMKTIPDPNFLNLVITSDKIKNYKKIVGEVCHDQRKFARSKKENNIIIKSNFEKAKAIINDDYNDIMLLNKQCEILNKTNEIYVLCTCPFYILDYNPNLCNMDD